MTAPTLMARLREETKTDHEAAETAFDLPRRLESLWAYRRLLTSLYRFYLPLEEAIAGHLPDPLASSGYCSKSTLLTDDLGVLEVEWAGLSPSGLPPSIASASQAAGSLYVLEGASLGGQIIARLAIERLHLEPDRGVSFFHGHGSETGTRWAEFRLKMEELGLSPEAQGEAVASAKSTFQAFQKLLEETP